MDPFRPDLWPTVERKLSPTPFPITPALIWLGLVAIIIGGAWAALT